MVEFLKALHRHLKGAGLMVIWDITQIHRSQELRVLIASTNGGIAVVRLLAYAPELNPVEYMWARLKQHEIVNPIVREAWQLSLQATAALRRIRRPPESSPLALLKPISGLEVSLLRKSQ